MKINQENQDNVKTIRKKIKILSKNEKTPPSSLSFQEWLVMGKKMGWDLQAESIPMILSTYEQDNDQIDRHTSFLREMSNLYISIDNVMCKMEDINSHFKTSDKQEIFDSQMIAQAEMLKGIAEYYREGAIEQKKKLCEQQAYLVFAKYKDDPDFKRHVDSFIMQKMKVA